MTPTTEQAGTLTRTVDEALDRMQPALETGAELSGVIHRAVLSGGEPARQVADVLHGTWLGHPLHPVLTDVTIGSWIMGAIFDAVGAIGDDDFARRMGDRLTAIGTATAVPTAVTGVTDYSTAPKPSLGTATVHGALNTIGLGLYLLSLRDRNQGRRRRGLAFSTLALGVTSASAWLGGHLVYRHRVGVDHAERFDGPEEWTAILDDAELAERKPRCAEWNDKKVLLYREAGEIYAIGTICSHAGGPLHQGEIDGPFVECPWHHSVFDMRDGSIKHGPATQPQATFDARVRDGRIEIRLRHS